MVIIINRTQSTMQNAVGILVLKRYHNLHFCPGCADQAQNSFLKFLKIKSHQQANPGKSLRTAPIIHYQV